MRLRLRRSLKVGYSSNGGPKSLCNVMLPFSGTWLNINFGVERVSLPSLAKISKCVEEVWRSVKVAKTTHYRDNLPNIEIIRTHALSLGASDRGVQVRGRRSARFWCASTLTRATTVEGLQEFGKRIKRTNYGVKHHGTGAHPFITIVIGGKAEAKQAPPPPGGPRADREQHRPPPQQAGGDRSHGRHEDEGGRMSVGCRYLFD